MLFKCVHLCIIVVYNYEKCCLTPVRIGLKCVDVKNCSTLEIVLRTFLGGFENFIFELFFLTEYALYPFFY